MTTLAFQWTVQDRCGGTSLTPALIPYLDVFAVVTLVATIAYVVWLSRHQ